ncbi:synaptotagmin-A-like isoform X2 [Lineus longissimus]|uniref:synaptotagmin-A-like isoform X2 n=1 Tax=Lineus longissimus TaxID=88925 RepID=UPI00315CAEDD
MGKRFQNAARGDTHPVDATATLETKVIVAVAVVAGFVFFASVAYIVWRWYTKGRANSDKLKEGSSLLAPPQDGEESRRPSSSIPPVVSEPGKKIEFILPMTLCTGDDEYDNVQPLDDRRYSLPLEIPLDADGRRPSTSSLHKNMPRRSSFDAFSIQAKEVDKDLYDSGDEFSHSPRGLGKICFSLSYSTRLNSLTVGIIKAIHLPAKNIRETADPFVKVKLLPDKKPKYETKTHRGTMNPEFEEYFVFPIRDGPMEEKVLKLTVCDHDRFSRPLTIGYASFPLGELKKEQIADPDAEEVEGHAVEVGGIVKIDEIWRDIHAELPKDLNKGELLYALAYDPNQGTIKVIILKGKDIKYPEAARETNGVYVKVILNSSEHMIKSKKTKTHRRRTNPVFNEEFCFFINPANIDRLSVTFSVCGRSIIGKNRVIGKSISGPVMYAAGQGLEHWKEMMYAPRSVISQWHTLV